MSLLRQRTRSHASLPLALSTDRLRPGRVQVMQQPLREAPFRWSITDAIKAIDTHDQGDFSRSAALAEAFGRDDRISACTSTRVRAYSSKNGLAFRILPADGDDDKRAKLVMAWWFDVVTDAVLAQIVRDMILMHVHLSRIHWDRTAREWRPIRLERWKPQNVFWNDELQRYCVHTNAGGDEVIEPDDPNWLLITPGGAESWMGGAVRALGVAYCMRQWNWRDWGRFNERYGQPIITIEEPSQIDAEKRKAFFGSIQKMGSSGMVRLPQTTTGVGFKLNLLEVKGTASSTFTDFRKDLDTAIAVCLLGQNLTTEVSGGSYAAAKVHGRIQQDYLDADTEQLATPLRAQLIHRWGVFNFADWDGDKTPWPSWDTTPPADRQLESDTLGKVATAVRVFQTTGMPVDYQRVFERVGIPMVVGSDPNDVAPPPAPAPPAPPKARAQRDARLASGASLAANSGFVNGQLYADDVAEDAAAKAAAAQADFLGDLLRIVDEGADYQAIRQAVLAHYRDAAPPEAVRTIIERALVLTQLAGQAAALEDDPADGD